MVELWLPYGTSEVPARVPEERLTQILKPPKGESTVDGVKSFKETVEVNQEFAEKVRRSNRVTIVSGYSRNVQFTAQILKALVSLLRSLGVPDNAITILRTPDGPTALVDALAPLPVIDHTDSSPTEVCKVEGIPFEVALNSRFVQADTRILLAELRRHHFLELGGLTDAVFPDLASPSSAEAQIVDRSGVGVAELGKERVRIAASLQNVFALGYILDSERNPQNVRFGLFEQTVNALRDTLFKSTEMKLEELSEIVIVSAGGAPLDATLLRAMESFPPAQQALKRGGSLIVAAECRMGHGNTEFYDWCAEKKEPRYLEARLRLNFNYNGFKAAYLQRLLTNHHVYLVSTIPDHYVENVFGMRSSPTVNAAIQSAQRIQGSDSTITVIPDASNVYPISPHEQESNRNP